MLGYILVGLAGFLAGAQNAIAGGGISLTATALGNGSTADAGAGLTAAGNVDFALAVGSMLDATATGTDGLVNIVFQP